MTKSAKIVLSAIGALFFLAGVVVSVAIYFAVSFYQAHQLFDQGVSAMYRRDYPTAIAKFQAALGKYLGKSYRAYAFGDLAFCESSDGRCNNALRDYTEAINLDPKIAWAYENRGILYDESAETDKALRDFAEAIRLEPNSYHAHFSRGLIEMERRDVDAAIEDFAEAARIDPSSAVAYYHRGVGYSLKKDYDRALANLDAAIGMNPRYSSALVERGYVYYEKWELDKAIADLNSAIRISPYYEAAYRTRGLALNDQKHWKEAVSDFNKALHLNSKDIAALEGRASAYSLMGEQDRAVSDFTAILLMWNVPQIYNRRGQAFYLKGDYDRAVADFREGVKLMPDDAAALNSLAWFLATCPDPKFRNGDEAVTVAMKACTVSNWGQAFYVDTLAAAYAETGQFNEAIAYQIKALSRDQLDSSKLDEMEKRKELYQQHKPYRQMIGR